MLASLLNLNSLRNLDITSPSIHHTTQRGYNNNNHGVAIIEEDATKEEVMGEADVKSALSLDIMLMNVIKNSIQDLLVISQANLGTKSNST